LEVFGVLTGVGVDVSKIFGVGAGAQSESEKCDSAHLCHACHPPLRASVSIWEGWDLQILLCRCLAPTSRDRITQTCRLLWVFPCCDNLSLGIVFEGYV